MKRLEAERFRWPTRETEVLQIGQRELAWLLDGLDIRQAHETLRYSACN
ncbi:IS66 family insertion sequence element accessory protein TnpB [Sulfidibacter corallicola]|nr:transposase [Sulfidibacter corallicola]QTD49089.1 IS66 family insertion sequence element accessory protein TnpB [Sulfidibacter corallicola]